ncbi:Retrovirus-related Pol polyprotein from transposon TNT 1-94 [Linum perenne]
MTGDDRLFSTLELKRGGKVTFGDNKKGRILGQGSIGLAPNPVFNNVMLVKSLKHNLLSISQLCGNQNKVIFEPTCCKIIRISDNKLLFRGQRQENIYTINLNDSSSFIERCFTDVDTSIQNIWHRKLGHISNSRMLKLSSSNLVRGLPLFSSSNEFFCTSCVRGKQTKTSFKSTSFISTSKPLQLLHIDLFGPTNVSSLGGKNYAFVIVDDYTRFTWVIFLNRKNESSSLFRNFVLMTESSFPFKVSSIRSDHGGEFTSENFSSFCKEKGINHTFSAPRTPQQNGVVERKNRALLDLARTMLLDHDTPKKFWAEAVATACYILNRTLIRKILNKTPYELLKQRSPNISYFHPFGCKCFVLNTKDSLGKFDPRSSEAIFLGYSDHSKAFRVFNKTSFKVEESIHVVFDDKLPSSSTSDEEQVDFLPSSEPTDSSAEPSSSQTEEPSSSQTENIPSSQPHISPDSVSAPTTEEASPSQSSLTSSPQAPPHIQKRHPPSLVIGSPSARLITRSKHSLFDQQAMISLTEPKNTKEALKDENWIIAMQEELNQFQRSQVWDLVPCPTNKTIIGTKWVYRNKTNDKGVVIRNKARLVAQGYNQEEGIDYDETFAPVARMEAIRLLCAFASINHFILFQMDVKSAFLNGFIKEEVYVAQPPGFEDPHFPNHVFRLKKALYGLKQAPRAWYDRLTQFLTSDGFSRGQVDTTLFIKRTKTDLLLVQIYVDDIVFGSTNKALCSEFCSAMTNSFEMSMMGQLQFFLGLQVFQCRQGIFIHQMKYIKSLLDKFDFNNMKPASTPMATTTKLDTDLSGISVDNTKFRGMIGSLLYLTSSRPDILYSVCLCARFQANPKQSHLSAVKRIFRYLKGTSSLGIWYPSSSDSQLFGYSDADFAGSLIDRKSTSGGCHFLGHSLVSWSSKKQTSIALSTAEAEYIAAGSSCTQLLWLRSQLEDYGVSLSSIPLLCDNTSAINMSKNPVQHSRTKHIEIKYHFLRELVQTRIIDIQFVPTSEQLADVFTKPLKEERFNSIIGELGMIDFSQIPSSQ